MGNLDDEGDYQKYIHMGFDALTLGRFLKVDYKFAHANTFKKKLWGWIRKISPFPTFTSYKDLLEYSFLENFESKEDMIPFIIPNWDHTPRSGKRGEVLLGSNPQSFYEHVLKVLKGVSKKKNKIVMLKSWNEWGEGNYMEPDLKYGKKYILALKKALNSFSAK